MKRYITVLDTKTNNHYCIDCTDTITAFKVAQYYHQMNEKEECFKQIRFRSIPAPKKLGYNLFKWVIKW